MMSGCHNQAYTPQILRARCKLRSKTAAVKERKCSGMTLQPRTLRVHNTYPVPETEKERSSVDYPQVAP